ncbi:MAG: ribonuclease P protein component [Gammaproteobacteria bacterium]|nr:ribonuclease P protein component [Gammaproteobacteria bacterium]
MGARCCRRGGPRAARDSAPEAALPDSPNGFPRWRRLTRQREFAQVFADAVRSHDGLFVVLCAPNGLGYARLGLAIARKRIARAHDRNHIKRLVRESFRLHQREFGGLDVVVMAQGRLAASDDPSRRRSLAWHWTQLATRCSRSSAPLSGATSAT